VKSLKQLPVIILLAIAAAVSACQGGGAGALSKSEQQAGIVSGKTSKQELLQRLGEPDQRTQLDNGKEEWLYLHENVSTHRNWFHPSHSGFWVVLKNNTVEAFGERATVPDQGHRFWPF
jgi:hypothetical protein